MNLQLNAAAAAVSKTDSMVSSSQSTLRSSFNSLVFDQFGIGVPPPPSSSSSTHNLQNEQTTDFIDLVALVAGDSLGLDSQSHHAKKVNYPSPLFQFQSTTKCLKKGLGGMPLPPRRQAPQPNLTFYHKTNEVVFRDANYQICAVLRCNSTTTTTTTTPKKSLFWSSNQQPLPFTIYGRTPAYPDQEDNVERIKIKSDKITLYPWATIQVTRCEKSSSSPRSFLMMSGGGSNNNNNNNKFQVCVEPVVAAASENNNTTSSNSYYVANEFTQLPRKSEWMVEIQEDRKLGAVETTTTLSQYTSSTASSSSTDGGKGSNDNKVLYTATKDSIRPDMDIKECISFLTSSNEFIEFVCCHR